MPTIYDVAARAGVSPATVSRVFNGSNVSEPLAARVRAAAADLSFVPNKSARRLRMQRSELITLMVPDIENPFFTAMTRAVEDEARAAGYSVLLCNTDDDEAKFAQYLNAVVSEPVAGILAVAPSQAVDLDVAIEHRVPVVCVDRQVPRYQLDSVVVDNVRAARDATTEMLEAGFRRVACITGPLSVDTARLREQGWGEAIVEASGQLADPSLVRRVPYTVAGGEEATRSLLDQVNPPDAIFAANNKLAAGVIRVLFEREMDLESIGVSSLGGLPLVTWQPRGIKVWHLPARDLGREAARLLLKRIDGKGGPAQNLVLPAYRTDDQDGYSQLDPQDTVTH